MQRHTEIIHERKEPFECKVSNKKLYQNLHLKLNMEDMKQPFYAMEQTRPVVECNVCCKKFNRKYNLKVHMEAVHERIRSQYDFCEKSYYTTC